MTTTPETAVEFADSNKCICCERSKSGGSFFEIRPYREEDDEGLPNAFYFGYGVWEADIDVFEEASRRGCQRCAVAFEMVTTYIKNNPTSDLLHISVWNSFRYPSMLAGVRVYLFKSGGNYLSRKTTAVALELLSANRRCPK